MNNDSGVLQNGNSLGKSGFQVINLTFAQTDCDKYNEVKSIKHCLINANLSENKFISSDKTELFH